MQPLELAQPPLVVVLMPRALVLQGPF